MAPEIITAINKAVQEAFSENGGDRRFIDVSRVPLICQSIVGINDNIKVINEKLDQKFVTKDSFYPVRLITFGMVGAILLAVVGGLMALLIK